MPIDGRHLVIEPTYPNAEALSDIGPRNRENPPEPDPELDGAKIRNRFWSFKHRADVVVYEKNGRVNFGLSRGPHPIDRLLSTLDCSSAWGVEQEARAIQTLGTLLPHHQFKTYLLTGIFIERSPRSKLSYVFRRLRPTVVLDTSGEMVKVRCALCMHPIGYYENTWAGAMTPTDDVIAHLMLMRGDEPMLWRRANQHPAYRPEAGFTV